jgi:ribonuclease R
LAEPAPPPNRKARRAAQTGTLPDREALLRFIADSPGPVGKREIAQAFKLKGADKIALKALLKDLEQDGDVERGAGRAFHERDGLPRVAVLKVVAITEDGDALAEPEAWDRPEKPPRIRLVERIGARARRHAAALGLGDRVLTRLEQTGPGRWRGHPMKRLEARPEAILGILRRGERGASSFRVQPVDKRARFDVTVTVEDLGGAEPGELVRAEPKGRPGRLGLVQARITERLGSPLAPRAASLIAIHSHGIPHHFADEVLAEAKRASTRPLGEREDLRAIPLITIDPADARDHDDAVWAAPDDDPDNPGGWRVIVAIADVSFYVRPGTALDAEARHRGNSTYFPDRVVPMLPEVLSADVCSLKPGVDRACLACTMVFGSKGAMRSFRFSRAVMRSAANLAYERAQAAIDGAGDAEANGVLDTVLKPLWGAWGALSAARDARAPLDLDLPERKVQLDEMGRVVAIAPRARLDAHRLIEDFMIAANVAAAKQLEAKRAPVVYRAHEPPTREKLVALRDMLETLGQPFALGQALRPAVFNGLIARVKGQDISPQVMEMVLRSQTQAYYTPQHLGHFGLSLASYAHFTSPIRRYADLLVHRALVSALHLGEAGLSEDEASALARTCEHISTTERRSMMAERDTIDRYVASFLGNRVGEVFATRLTGVARFGLFATVLEVGGDGFVPVSTLGDERFAFDEKANTLTGQWSGTSYRVGQRLPLKLVEANAITGSLRFELVAEGDAEPGAAPPVPHRDRSRRRQWR